MLLPHPPPHLTLNPLDFSPHAAQTPFPTNFYHQAVLPSSPLSALLPRDLETNFCPRGTSFYVCNAYNFRGCCTVNPCDPESGGCPDIDPEMDNHPHETDHDSSVFSSQLPTSSEKQQSETTLFDGDHDTVITATGTAPVPKTTKMTDSGTTHTIPNDSVVTVTKHTVITTGALPEPISSEVVTTSTLANAPGASTTFPAQASPTGTVGPTPKDAFPIGAIVGAAVGGTVLFVILSILALLWKRRRRDKQTTDSRIGGGQYVGNGVDEKQLQAGLSAHTTGTHAESDPFAPFGGRVDDPNRPQPGVFEMDATSNSPVELPTAEAHLLPHSGATATCPRGDTRHSETEVRQTKATDPRANLNFLRTSSGQPTYVNHWNQWKEIGGS